MPGQALRQLLQERRSTKHFRSGTLALPQVGAALWAALGCTADGHRTVPSARAGYPVAATLIAGRIDGLDPGSYHYNPVGHTLDVGTPGDHRALLAGATLDAQDWLATCPALLLLSANPLVARQHFPDQSSAYAERFVWLEAGHVSQNVYLWAADNQLGTVLVAGLASDAQDAAHTFLPSEHHLLGIMALGTLGK